MYVLLDHNYEGQHVYTVQFGGLAVSAEKFSILVNNTTAANKSYHQCKEHDSRAVFTHCYGNSLNLAVGNTVKQCKVMKSSLETVNDISKPIMKSPKQDALFQKLKQGLAPETAGYRTLCPTRWTVHAASLKSALDNYEVLFALWKESLESPLESDFKARVIGVQAQMRTFNFLYGVSLGALILAHSDNLSKTLQHKSMSAAEGQQIAKLSLNVLKWMRQPEQFQLFYKRVLLIRSVLGFLSHRYTSQVHCTSLPSDQFVSG